MAAFWAVNFSVVKYALEPLPPFAFNALRYPLAAVTVYLLLRRRGPIPLPRRADLGKIVTLGVIGNVLYQVLFILGMDRTRAGNASLLLAGAPIWTALLATAAGHERLTAATWAGIAATVVGMGMVVAGGPEGLNPRSATFVGDVVLIASSVAWAIYTVAARGPIARYGSMAVTAWTLWIGTGFLVLIGVPDLVSLDRSGVGAGALAAVAYSGVFSIAAAYLLWYNGVRVLGSTRTATYGNVVPVLALAVAWLWLGEVPTLLQLGGAVVIIGGISLARQR